MKFLLFIVSIISFVFGSVDINSASVKELSTLKGIGIKKANAIVAYREKHCFHSVNELTNVNGIGQKILEKNSNNIEVSVCSN